MGNKVDKAASEIVLAIIIGIFILIGIIVLGGRWLLQQRKGPEPAKPAGATIKITEKSGRVWWTRHINFNEPQTCVVFTAQPENKNTVVCGDYRMQGYPED